MKRNNEDVMELEPVKILVPKLAIPVTMSLLVSALYNIIDSIFIARISENALTALSLSYPIQLLMISISVGTGVGVNAILSKHLGMKDSKGVTTIAQNALLLAFISYLIFLIFGLFGAKMFFAKQTDNYEIFTYGVEYISICTIFSFGIFFQIIIEKFLQSVGKAKLFMISKLIGAILNIILDPILIFGFGNIPAFGIRGAAYATVIGQIAAMIVIIIFNYKFNPRVKITAHKFIIDLKFIYEIYKVGLPAMIMRSLDSVIVLGVNLILGKISLSAISTYSICFKVQNFVFMIVYGINNALIPIVAYNYGAKNKERINQTVKYSLIYGEISMVVSILLLQILAPQIMQAFNSSEELLTVRIIALRIISLSYVFAGFNILIQSFFQALGNGIYSLIISLLRVIVILLPILYLLSQMFNLNITWLGFIISEVITAVISIFLARKVYAECVVKVCRKQIGDI
ncbi:MATE family efflux transporter [Crassaminicella profunda]|uniref:MATE family efflux transporter n=1 Tax=Crassaminicella profunda TaxID=1286698 RepID=UPI001CA73B44|nr:MATE family efflux transporter [Crassaminicella profunda]QZY56060.1 MATE family efflux transporter [Crassaminicella profunda]